MKLGIGLIILGTIFMTDGVIQMLLIGWDASSYAAVMMGGTCIKLVIGAVLLFFGIRRVNRKRQKEVQG